MRVAEAGIYEYDDTATFLGVTVDSGLTWECHVNTLTSKLSRLLYLIRSLTKRASLRVVLSAYYSYFHSRLCYSILNWGHSAHASRVFGLQRRCIRVIGGLGYRDCCRDHFGSLGVLTVPCIYILNCLIYFRDHLASHAKHSDLHSYPTRGRDNFVHDYLRVTRARDGTNYYCVKFFNALPDRARNLDKGPFKDVLKKYLISKAFYSFEEYLDNNFNDLYVI